MKLVHLIEPVKKTAVFLLLMTVFLLINVSNVKAQQDKFKALYIYNFTKYMQWPAALQSGDFIVGVLGQSGVEEELKKLAQVKKVGDTRNLVVKRFNSAAEISRCHIVFIASENTEELSAVVERCDKKGILIVTDGKDLAKKGSCINFVLVGTSQKFELSQVRVKRQGIVVASKFLNLAILVD